MSRTVTTIDTAKSTLVCEQPFFACLLMKARYIEEPGRPTMSTDGKHIWYNPEFTDSLTHNEVVGVLCHEGLHIAMAHPLRREGRDPLLWNIACDYAINLIIRDAHLTLPQGALLDERFRDQSPEEIYTTLLEENPPPPQPGQPGDEGTGEGQGGEPSQPPSEGQGDQPGPQLPQWGQVEDPQDANGQPLDEQTKKELIDRAKVELTQAANAAKKEGKLPAGLEIHIADLLKPKLPWRTILSRWMGDLARTDYSFRFPNKRYLQSGFALPSLLKESLGKVIFGMDTSGSMMGEELKEIISEAWGAMQEYEKDGIDPTLTVIWCDTQVHEQIVTDPREFKPQGGGGTMFSPVFDHIREHHETPRAIIYLTDGYCHDFGEEPDCPVLWGLTRTNRSFDPPWGEVMVIEP